MALKAGWRNESDISQGISLQEKPTVASRFGLS